MDTAAARARFRRYNEYFIGFRAFPRGIMSHPAASRRFRLAVGGMPAVILAGPLFVAAAATRLSLPVAGLIALVGAVVAGRAFAVRVSAPSRWDRGAKLLLTAWLLGGAVAAYRLGRLSVYMHDVVRTDFAFNPTIREFDDPELFRDFHPRHNCFTCYIVASHLADERVDNLYDLKYHRRAEEPTAIHDQIGDALTVDTYQYPPTFLLLPKLLTATGGDFYQLRSYWFGLNALVLVAVLVALFLWIGGRQLSATWLALPALIASPIFIATMQMQNVHLLIILISIAALPAFAANRNALGGALLGFAAVGKLFPAMLVIFLLLQKRWRAVLWTGGWMIAYALLTLIVFGPKPYEAFFSYQMPRLAGGEAFSFAAENFAALTKNTSVLGIAHKLGKLGVLSNPAPIAKTLVWGYTVVLVAVLIVVGRRRFGWTAGPDTNDPQNGHRRALACAWVAILVLAQLRSPFLPWSYGNLAVLMLLTLLFPIRRSEPRAILRAILIAIAWAMLAVTIPLAAGPPIPAPDIIFTLCATVVTFIAVAAALKKRGPVIAAIAVEGREIHV
jgi:hypothetical protein